MILQGLTQALGCFVALALAAALAACSQKPDYVRPEAAVPDAYRNREEQAGREVPRPHSRWWWNFGSPELNRLVDTALAQNHDLKAAVHRIRQAEALAGVAAGTLFPTVQATAGAEIRSPAGGTGVRTIPEYGKSERSYEAGFEASYEVDFWGRNRSAAEAALANAQASIFDRETLAITLVSDVVLTYFRYLQTDERLAVAKGNVRNMGRVLETVEKRFAIGEGNELEVMQQRNALAQAKAVVPVLALERERSLNQLAVLLGTPPRDLAISATPLQVLTVPAVEPGLPSALLLRRPDIRKAEADLVSANADIGVARAKLFPSFTLTAERGWGSYYLDQFLSPGSIFWSLAANVAQTIFDNGATRSEIAYREARYDELVENYRKAILASFRDVEDALAAVRLTEEQEKAQRAALAHAREAYDLSQRSFIIGMTDYLTVLDTERTKYDAEDRSIRARFARLQAAVDLYKALGGGAEAAPVAAPATGNGETETAGGE